MKIGIVALTWQPGKSGGVETYFRNLLEALQEIDRINSYCVYIPQGIDSDLKLTSSNFRLVKVDVSPKLIRDRVRRRLGVADPLSERLRKFLKNERLDVVHFPLQIMFPMGLQEKTIVSCMDIQQEYYPEFFSLEELNARRLAYQPSLEGADLVISISDFTKKTLEEKYKIGAEKVRTVYLSHDDELFVPSRKRPKPGKPYFYYPAATWPHKNHASLLKAFALVKNKYPNTELYLSGIAKSKNQEIAMLEQELGIQGYVKKLGYLDTSEMPAIYQNATGVVFPSLFEGFGIPLLEAMACGCPVAASNTTSIPEVAGDAAIYFNPADPQDIASKMELILTDRNLREALHAKGLERVKDFSPRIMATQTLNVYEEVANV